MFLIFEFHKVMQRYIAGKVEIFVISFFLSLLGWHALPSHASAEACLTDWPNAQPLGLKGVLRDTTRNNYTLHTRTIRLT